MAVPSSTPPLLLTKRLTAFLHANQSPQLPTLLLTTSHGKLLAHASPNPVSLLRTHATVAASLFAIHTSSSVAVPSALPGSNTPDPVPGSPLPPTAGVDGDGDDEDGADDDSGIVRDATSTGRTSRRRSPTKPGTITVQLSGGTVVIRRLKCGLLFVCIGPASGDQDQHHPQHANYENGELPVPSGPGSPSEVESLNSVGGQTTASLESTAAAAVVSLRRHAAELSRWLDDKLGALRVPEEGVGV
ncbi:hypothetical protein HJFPF1_09052 [Paramyrothecium foliicola]|nr:hypothetical protein HJFPF1_09052 [Paramyrothecium foliicola]